MSLDRQWFSDEEVARGQAVMRRYASIEMSVELAETIRLVVEAVAETVNAAGGTLPPGVNLGDVIENQITEIDFPQPRDGYPGTAEQWPNDFKVVLKGKVPSIKEMVGWLTEVPV